MSASFDINISGSTIGGLQVGKYVRESNTKKIFTIIPDTVLLPTSYTDFYGTLKWNDVAVEYYNDGAVNRKDIDATSYHRLVKLDSTHYLCLVVDVSNGTPENPSRITNAHFWMEDTSTNRHSLVLGGQPLLVGNGKADVNFLFISDAIDSDGRLFKYCVHWGAYYNATSETGTAEEPISSGAFTQYAEDGGIFTRFIPNQYLELEEYFFKGVESSNNILNSVGNAGSAAWDATNDEINLPRHTQP